MLSELFVRRFFSLKILEHFGTSFDLVGESLEIPRAAFSFIFRVSPHSGRGQNCLSLATALLPSSNLFHPDRPPIFCGFAPLAHPIRKEVDGTADRILSS
jgi:hypothetical protein